MHRALVLLLLVWLLPACARVLPTYHIPPVTLGEPSFFPTLEAYTQSPIVGGNRVDVLLNGDEIFPALIEGIRQARHTITYAQYFFADGAVSKQVAGALAERCRAGIGVNVLLDAVGAFGLPGDYAQGMERSGCHVAWFRPLEPWQLMLPWRLPHLNKRNHRRITVIDGRVGFTGGSGVSDQWMGDGRRDGYWRDTDVRIEGPVVQQLQAAFAESWRETTGMILGGDAYFPALDDRGSVYAQVVKSSPSGGAFEAYMLFLLSIESARRSISLTNPYFVPDQRMKEALLGAVRRGVKVRALVPGKIDHNLVRQASRGMFGDMLRAGVEIYEYRPGLLHSKTMVVDGILATVGSTNLDNRSFALNEELNLTVYDTPTARRLEEVFENDLKGSTRVTYRKWSGRGIVDRFLEFLTVPIREQL